MKFLRCICYLDVNWLIPKISACLARNSVEQSDIFQYQSYSHSVKSNINTDTSIFVFSRGKITWFKISNIFIYQMYHTYLGRQFWLPITSHIHCIHQGQTVSMKNLFIFTLVWYTCYDVRRAFFDILLIIYYKCWYLYTEVNQS